MPSDEGRQCPKQVQGGDRWQRTHALVLTTVAGVRGVGVDNGRCKHVVLWSEQLGGGGGHTRVGLGEETKFSFPWITRHQVFFQHKRFCQQFITDLLLLSVCIHCPLDSVSSTPRDRERAPGRGSREERVCPSLSFCPWTLPLAQASQSWCLHRACICVPTSL